MSKKAKNAAQKLSAADKEILNKVVWLYVFILYTLTRLYPDPKKLVEKMVKKWLANHQIARYHTMAYAQNAPSNYSFKPRELNQRLANDLSTIQQNCNDMLEQQTGGNHKQFMHQRALREKVLKYLEYNGILLRLEGKKEIKNYKREKRRRGRPSLKSSAEAETDSGGRPSLYVTTEEFANFKKILNKSGAQDFLRDKIIGSNLALELVKYQVLCSLYIAKTEEQAFRKVFGVGASMLQLSLPGEESSALSRFHQRTKTMDNVQLDKAAVKWAKKLIEEKGYHAF